MLTDALRFNLTVLFIIDQSQLAAEVRRQYHQQGVDRVLELTGIVGNAWTLPDFDPIGGRLTVYTVG